jgi:hypothetical protein
MTRVSVGLQVKTNIKLVQRNLENLRLELPKIAKSRLQEAGREIIRRMSIAGKRITYPVDWESTKQRVKVIILILRRQGRLPYTRTGHHQRGWKMEATANGVKVYNAFKGSKYLYGTMRSKRQSSIHVGRWPILRTVYDSVIKSLPKKVKESLRKVPKLNG